MLSNWSAPHYLGARHGCFPDHCIAHLKSAMCGFSKTMLESPPGFVFAAHRESFVSDSHEDKARSSEIHEVDLPSVLGLLFNFGGLL